MNNGRTINVLYHELQVSDQCGKHALNNLVQRELFTVEMLDTISLRLSRIEATLIRPSQTRTVFGIGGSWNMEVLQAALIEQGLTPVNLTYENIVEISTRTSAGGFLISKIGHFYSMRRLNEDGPLWLFDSMKPRPYIDNDHFNYLINRGGDLNYILIVQVYDRTEQLLPAMPSEASHRASQVLSNEAFEIERCSQVTRTFSTLSFNPSEEEIFSGTLSHL